MCGRATTKLPRSLVEEPTSMHGRSILSRKPSILQHSVFHSGRRFGLRRESNSQRKSQASKLDAESARGVLSRAQCVFGDGIQLVCGLSSGICAMVLRRKRGFLLSFSSSWSLRVRLTCACPTSSCPMQAHLALSGSREDGHARRHCCLVVPSVTRLGPGT